MKGLEKIRFRLYIRECTFNKINYYQSQIQQPRVQHEPDKLQVPEKWRDAFKLPKFIKLGVVSYNN